MTQRGATDADIAVYGQLLRQGLTEPENFTFAAGPVEFILPGARAGLAIIDEGESENGLAALQSAALRSRGIIITTATRQEALRNPGRIVRELLTGRP